MSDLDDVKRVLGEAEEYAAALDRREERKEIYLMVASRMLNPKGAGSEGWNFAIKRVAEAVYEGMLKFVGDKA